MEDYQRDLERQIDDLRVKQGPGQPVAAPAAQAPSQGGIDGVYLKNVVLKFCEVRVARVCITVVQRSEADLPSLLGGVASEREGRPQQRSGMASTLPSSEASLTGRTAERDSRVPSFVAGVADRSHRGEGRHGAGGDGDAAGDPSRDEASHGACAPRAGGAGSGRVPFRRAVMRTARWRACEWGGRCLALCWQGPQFVMGMSEG